MDIIRRTTGLFRLYYCVNNWKCWGPKKWFKFRQMNHVKRVKGFVLYWSHLASEREREKENWFVEWVNHREKNEKKNHVYSHKCLASVSHLRSQIAFFYRNGNVWILHASKSNSFLLRSTVCDDGHKDMHGNYRKCLHMTICCYRTKNWPGNRSDAELAEVKEDIHNF